MRKFFISSWLIGLVLLTGSYSYATDVTYETAKFTWQWSDPTGKGTAAGFILRCGRAVNVNEFTKTINNPAARAFFLRDFVPRIYEDFTCNVLAVNNVGPSAWSNTVVVKILPPVILTPEAPHSLEVK